MVATQGWARRGTLKSRLDMKWERQRCHEAPAKTVAVVSLSPRWASEVTRSASRAFPALGTLPRHRPRLSPLPRSRLSPLRLSTPPWNRPHRDGQRQAAGAAIARKDGRGYGSLWGAPGGLNPAVWRRRPATAGVCGGHRYPSHSPPPNARYGHPRATSIVGLTSPPATKVRDIARCIGQRAYGRRGDLLLGL